MKLITHNYAGLGFVFKAHQLLHTRILWPLTPTMRLTR